jgi:ComF family protein
MFTSLIDLLFPLLCVGCSKSLMKNEQYFCAACQLELPVTDYHLQPANQLEKNFWGRTEIEKAFAYLYFRKDGMVQKILHEIKYKSNKELAIFIGEQYGAVLVNSGHTFDGLMAVPLHKNKLRIRGYNQSDLFVTGLANTMNIPILSEAVSRNTATESQTRKGRYDRWTNVSEVFTLNHEDILFNKRILVCDDVITTGATLEALVKILPDSCKVSLCAIAVPER